MYVSQLGEQWHRARVEPGVVHLDSAAAGRSSNAVIEAMTAHLWRESKRGSYVAAADRAEQLSRYRDDLAQLIGHRPDEVSFHDSARSALRALLSSWDLPAPTTVWVATNEFGPNLLEFERRGFAVRPLPDADVHGRVDVDALDDMLQSEQPTFIHVCQIGSMSGVVQPVGPIVEIAHRAGIPVVIDMAQSAGHVPTVTGADIVYGTSRKWLTGPRGVGFAAVRVDALRPVEIESSETFIAGLLGLGIAVSEIEKMGQHNVFRELAAVGHTTRERLDGVGGWEVVEPVDEPSATVTLAPPSDGQIPDVIAARDKLLGQGLLVTAAESWRAPLSSGRSVLRVSPHLDVRHEDLDRLAEALRAMRSV